LAPVRQLHRRRRRVAGRAGARRRGHRAGGDLKRGHPEPIHEGVRTMASRTARARGPLAAFLAAVLTLGLVVVAATSASADVWDDRRAAAEARAKAAASAAERIEHELEGTKTAIVQAAVELE